MVFCAWLYEETVATVYTVLSLHLRQNVDKERGTATDTEKENGRNIANF